MTLRTRIVSTMVLTVGLCGSLLALHPPTPVAADTQVPYNVPPAIPASPYTLPTAVVTAYSGHYRLQRINTHAHINDGGIYIRRRDPNSLLGLVQFYGWDQAGHQTSWFAVLSNFHAMAHGQMHIDLLNQTGGPLHDELTVTRMANGDLMGTFYLDGKNYAIRWHKVSAT